MADWLELGATVLGGLLGSKAGKDQTQTETQTKAPWAPAQPYMLENLKNESALQKYYQQTPFNPQQTQAYSNLFGDIGHYRDNVMPGLMDFANRGMTSSYDRQRGGAPGSGAGYGGGIQPGGMRQSGQGPFSVARGAQPQNPMLDLNGAQNPFANGRIAAPTAPTAPQAPTGNPLIDRAFGGGADRGGSGSSGQGVGGSESSGFSGFGGGSSEGNEASDGWGMNQYGYGFAGPSLDGAATGLSVGGLPGALVGGLLGGVYSDPLGKFAYDALREQEVRDMANRGFGGGTGYGGSYGGNIGTGGFDGGFQGSFGSGSVGGTGGGFGGGDMGGYGGNDNGY